MHDMLAHVHHRGEIQRSALLRRGINRECVPAFSIGLDVRKTVPGGLHTVSRRGQIRAHGLMD